MVLSALLLAFCVLPCLAESITLNGNVVSVASEKVTVRIGGTLKSISAAAGQHVSAGEELAALETVKVYAQESGIVRYFGAPGENTETVAAKYGAVAYIEPDGQYSISASTKNAYDSEETKTIHPGEKVYLRCYTDGKHTGTGVVTLVSGNSFTVEVDSGSYESGESVSVYRDQGYTTSLRIGRGNITRKDPIAYAGEGSIVKFCAKDGDHVNKGDALFETLTGTFDGLKMTGSAILSPTDGIVSSISALQGDVVEKGAAIAEIYPDSGMRISASVSESDLCNVQVGSQVKVEFMYANEIILITEGTVESISFLAQEKSAEDESDEASYEVLVSFVPDALVRYGMNALITTAK